MKTLNELRNRDIKVQTKSAISEYYADKNDIIVNDNHIVFNNNSKMEWSYFIWPRNFKKVAAFGIGNRLKAVDSIFSMKERIIYASATRVASLVAYDDLGEKNDTVLIDGTFYKKGDGNVYTVYNDLSTIELNDGDLIVIDNAYSIADNYQLKTFIKGLKEEQRVLLLSPMELDVVGFMSYDLAMPLLNIELVDWDKYYEIKETGTQSQFIESSICKPMDISSSIPVLSVIERITEYNKGNENYLYGTSGLMGLKCQNLHIEGFSGLRSYSMECDDGKWRIFTEEDSVKVSYLLDLISNLRGNGVLTLNLWHVNLKSCDFNKIIEIDLDK